MGDMNKTGKCRSTSHAWPYQIRSAKNALNLKRLKLQ